jgi:hypothetical protein
MKNTITFTYNPYTYFHSYQNTLKNIRKWYTDESIYIYMDSFRNDLDKYKNVSDEYNCNFIVRDSQMYYINSFESTEVNLPKMMEWLRRIKYTCENANSEWIMLVEDDVLIKRKIQTWPSSDCGKNKHDDGFLGGGSIFRREVYIKAYESIGEAGLEKLIRENHLFSWAGDMTLKALFGSIGASSEKWVELAEPSYFDNTDHAVFHRYKELHRLG